MPPDEQTDVESNDSDDLRTLISRAFDEHEVKSDAPEPTETRQRDANGKFAKAEPTESSDEIVPEAAEPVEKPAVEEKPAAETEKPATEAPNTWKAEDKEVFKGLPTEAQQFLLRRHGEMEADYTRKTQQHAAFVRDYEPVRQVLAPFDAQIRQSGFTPASLIQAWSNVEKALMEGRGVEVVRDLVTNYKMDRAQVARVLGLTGAGGTGGAGTEAPPTPQDHNGQQPIQLPPEIAQKLQVLERGQQQFDQFLTTQQEQQRREAEHRVNSTIEAFKGAKDSSGNLLHPHWDELENDMVELWKVAAAAGQQPTLDAVYDKAVWANTSTRQKLRDAEAAASEAQRAAATKKAQDEARAKAERARKASSSVSGAPGSAQSRMTQQPGDRSLRDELSAAFDELADA